PAAGLRRARDVCGIDPGRTEGVHGHVPEDGSAEATDHPDAGAQPSRHDRLICPPAPEAGGQLLPYPAFTRGCHRQHVRTHGDVRAADDDDARFFDAVHADLSRLGMWLLNLVRSLGGSDFPLVLDEMLTWIYRPVQSIPVFDFSSVRRS